MWLLALYQNFVLSVSLTVFSNIIHPSHLHIYEWHILLPIELIKFLPQKLGLCSDEYTKCYIHVNYFFLQFFFQFINHNSILSNKELAITIKKCRGHWSTSRFKCFVLLHSTRSTRNRSINKMRNLSPSTYTQVVNIYKVTIQLWKIFYVRINECFQ